LIKHVSKKNSR